MEVYWECQENKNEWVKFPPEINKQLNSSKTSTVDLKIDSKTVTFDFVQMKQKISKISKDIRCIIINDDGEHVLWEHQKSRHRWMSFPPKIAYELEKNKEEDAVDVEFNENMAEIDFKNMKMSMDENVVDIRRIVVAAEVKTIAKQKPQSKRKKINEEEPEIDKEMETKKKKLEKVLKKRETKKLFAEVDSYVPNSDDKQVYIEKNDVYSVMLNQTNAAQNNNKYFLIQVLESKNEKQPKFWTFFRWGRVGFKGQTNLIDCGKDLDKAKDIFLKKFSDKTHNEFEDRNKFVKIKGKYDLIQMDYSKTTEQKQQISQEKIIVESKLDEKIQNLLKTICDFKKMEETARGLSYDIDRAPLGNLTKKQIKAGYEALTRIENCIFNKNFNKEFKDALDEYYTRIPHYFGMRQPSPIKELDELKREIELLEVLSDIEAAMTSANQQIQNVEKLHPLDETYQKLKCDLKPLDKNSERFKLIESYLQKTHAPQHDSYEMSLKTVFEVIKHGEDENFKADIGNRRLLWHGSRLTNWHGILSRGLKIAPKEAPVTGYMFGKGVYFADMSSKSANYCLPKHGENGFLILAEVALGEMNPKFKADSKAHKLPENKHSVKGMGNIGPNPGEFVTIDDGVIVPCGTQTQQEETKNLKNNDLIFNEYVVYDVNQIKLRYLVEVEFTSKQKKK